jgi:hypothetical protein
MTPSPPLFRVAALVFSALATVALGAPSIGGCQIFPANNYWNTPVDEAPVHASSAAWVNKIGTAAKLHPDWGNVLADNYGIPFMTVTAAQPNIPIMFDPADNASDESDPGPYPIPLNAPIEGGSGPTNDGDRHVIVLETTNCRLYELYSAYPKSGFWQVYSAAKFDMNSNALRPADWTSADAAGFAVLPGLVRWEEVAAGEINHAIRFTAAQIWGSNAGQPYYLWPARHWSGSSTDSTRPPMGARFRLKASFNISGFDPRTQVILRAFKKYGMVLSDGGSNWYFSGVSNANWPDVVLDELKSIAGGNFEAVDTSGMMVSPNSAEAIPPGGPTHNVQGLWWNSPAGSESGWGVNLTQQGDILFATHFTYDTDGSGMWLVMSNGAKTAANTYTGTLYRTTGPAFSEPSWNPSLVAYTPVGSGTFTFSNASTGTYAYTVNGTSRSKAITRLAFDTPPTCVASTTGSSTNYSDLWWNASESGWGVNLQHQGSILFATWFTYDATGKGLWLVMSNAGKIGDGIYSGTIYRTVGTPLLSAWVQSQHALTPVGVGTFTFPDFYNGTFAYDVNGVPGSKTIVRNVFSTPATVCN